MCQISMGLGKIIKGNMVKMEMLKKRLHFFQGISGAE